MAGSIEERACAAGTPEDAVSLMYPTSTRVHSHDSCRHINLALLQQYGSNAWRIHNYLGEATAKNIESALEELKNLTTEVNRDRKNYQVRASWIDMRRRLTGACLQTRLGTQLTTLETRWTELISSILQIEMANVALEVEIDRLNKREVELAAAL